MTRLSVVIPALDDSVMLRRALADLAAQTRPADEIVVVDNGSTDDTAAVARAAGAVVVEQPVRGIPMASSTGFDAATGELIARLDADSRPHADWLERIEAAFADAPELDVLTGPGEFYGDRAWANWIGEHLYIAAYFNIVGPWLGNSPIFGSNFAMRASVWHGISAHVHREHPDIHDDLDIVLHLPIGAVIRFDPTLRVGVSARPFESWSGFLRRLSMAFRTFALHWPEASPWQRHAAKRRAARAAAEPEVLPGALPEDGFGDAEPQPAH